MTHEDVEIWNVDGVFPSGELWGMGNIVNSPNGVSERPYRKWFWCTSRLQRTLVAGIIVSGTPIPFTPLQKLEFVLSGKVRL